MLDKDRGRTSLDSIVTGERALVVKVLLKKSVTCLLYRKGHYLRCWLAALRLQAL